MLKRMIFLGLIAVSCFSLAETAPTSLTTEVSRPSHPLSIMLLGDALVLKGAGLKSTYQVADNVALGVMGKFYQLNSDSESSSNSLYYNNYKHDITKVGAVVDFFPMGSTDSRGLYISAGVSSSNLKTTVDDSMFGKNTATDSKVGAELTVGYQFVIRIRDAANIMFQVGGGYGGASGVEWKAFTASETKLKDGLVLDLVAGAQF